MYEDPGKKRNIRLNALYHLAIPCMVLVCLSLTTWLHAKDYSFAWFANPEPVEGYRLYYKKGGEAAPPFDGTDALKGPSPIDVGKQTSYTITGLDENSTYHFALTAYNGSNESGYTEVITKYGDTTERPSPGGSKAFIFSLEHANATDIIAYRVYLNDKLLCGSFAPTGSTLTCYTDLLNEIMYFTVTSVDSSGTESAKSTALVFDPSEYPQLFNQKKATFTWEYDSADSSVSGFNIYHNSNLLCNTTDSTARQLNCEFTIESTNIFSVTTIDTAGTESPVSNSLSYTIDSTTSDTDMLTASYTTSGQDGIAPFSVTFDATSSTGMIQSYSWAFGDGETATGKTVTHSYLSAGNFTATLTVTSTINVATQSNAVIMVTEPTATEESTESPVAVISSSTAFGAAPLTVQFDGSGSTATQQPITSYAWDLGDGNLATGTTASHTYTLPGSYNTSLTVTDNVGQTDITTAPVIVASTSTDVNEPPISSFTTSAIAGTAPLTVTFYGSSSTDPDGLINKYLWNFGDGTSASGISAQHTFHYAGDYTATLKVTDDQGSTAVSSKTLSITNQGEIPFNFELLEADIDQNWIRLEYNKEFLNPVVIAGPPSYDDPDPTIVRVRNIDTTGFEVRLQEWEYQDEIHSREKVSFLVMEHGAFTVDGTKLEAGTFSGTTSFNKIVLQQSYDQTPIVLTKIITVNESDAVISRLKNIAVNSFEYKIQEKETTQTSHATETINYIAWEPGLGTISGFQYETGTTSLKITDIWTTVNYQTTFSNLPLLLADLQTHIDGETATLRSRQPSNQSIQMKVEEEQSLDDETSHGSEVIGYLAFGGTPSGSEQPESPSPSDKLFTFTWTASDTKNISGFRIYLNNNLLCETANPEDRQLTCYSALLNDTMEFTMTAVFLDGSESPSSPLLSISPADYPEFFNIKLASFTWELDPVNESDLSGFRIYNNNNQICATTNPSDRQITCKTQLNAQDNTFVIKAIDTNNQEVNTSNTVDYKP